MLGSLSSAGEAEARDEVTDDESEWSAHPISWRGKLIVYSP